MWRSELSSLLDKPELQIVDDFIKAVISQEIDRMMGDTCLAGHGRDSLASVMEYKLQGIWSGLQQKYDRRRRCAECGLVGGHIE